MDLGRQDFPDANALMWTWSVGSLTGDADWMEKGGLFRAPQNASVLDPSSAARDLMGRIRRSKRGDSTVSSL